MSSFGSFYVDQLLNLGSFSFYGEYCMIWICCVEVIWHDKCFPEVILFLIYFMYLCSAMTMMDVCCICYMNECYCGDEWSDVIYYQYTIYANRSMTNDAILIKLSLKYLLIMKLIHWFHTLPSYCWKLGFDSFPSTNWVRLHPIYGFCQVGSNPSELMLRKIMLVGNRESGNPYQRGFVGGLRQHTPVGDSVWDLCTKIPELWI